MGLFSLAGEVGRLLGGMMAVFGLVWTVGEVGTFITSLKPVKTVDSIYILFLTLS